ncbi:MAG: hypothetical protein ACLR8Y_02220 [Alistipes indistinctus]
MYRDFVNHRTKLIPTKVRFKNFGHPVSEGVLLQYNPRNGRYQVPPGDINLLDNSDWLQPQQADFPNDEVWTPGSDLPF